MVPCVYRRDEIDRDCGLHECLLHGRCRLTGESNGIAVCETCRERLDPSGPLTEFADPLKIVDRSRTRTHALRNMLSGTPAFLVCGGPSAKPCLPLLDRRRGLWTMAVNNVAGAFRPNAFVCADPPSKFHNGIWQDPGVMKFLPDVKFGRSRGRVRRKLASGEFEPAGHVTDMPNVWGFARRSWLKPDQSFFTEPDAAWGNHQAGVLRTGLEKVVCTMLLGMRLLYYLGARRIYLVGVDFWMDPGKPGQGNYAFAQDRDQDAIESNNRHFAIINDWLSRMQADGVFEAFGLSIYNCCEVSGLTAFYHVPIMAAINEALSVYPPEPFDLRGWYEK